MKVLVLHGDDKKSLTKRLDVFYKEAKKRSWDIVRITKTSSLGIRDELTAGKLFANEALHSIDYSLLLPADKKWLMNNYDEIEGTLVIYSDKLLSKTALKELPATAKIEEYKLPVVMWKFFESVYPGNEKEALTLFHQTLEKEAPELVFSLLAKHIKDVYLIQVDETSLNLPSWRLAKIKSQMKSFTKPSLESFIKNLSIIDSQSKSGGPSFREALDLVLIKGIK